MIGFIDRIHKKNMTRVLKKKQAKVDEIFEKEGLTDKVLEMQLEINCIRNRENLQDPNEQVFEEYVQ